MIGHCPDSKMKKTDVKSSELPKLFLEVFIEKIMEHHASKITFDKPLVSKTPMKKPEFKQTQSNPNAQPIMFSETPTLSIMHQDDLQHPQPHMPIPANRRMPLPQNRMPQFNQRNQYFSSIQNSNSSQIKTGPLIRTSDNINPMDRLMPIMMDRQVTGIECPGANKNIIVHKAMMKQNAPIILTEEEIKSILEEISKRTKIPAIEGLFKVMINNLLFTALVSEFAGTRFKMEKIHTPINPRPMMHL